jgi:hypothetical protein
MINSATLREKITVNLKPNKIEKNRCYKQL